MTETTDHMHAAIAKFQSANILVIGDIIVDHFIWGSVSRISPEAPVPVVNVTKENLLLGGAANVLHNIYALGGKATLCGIIGDDPMGDHLAKLLAELPSPLDGIIRANSRPTTVKTRIIAQNQQVVRFDREESSPLPDVKIKKLTDFIDANIDKYQAIIISDYNKGIISPQFMDHLRKKTSGNHTIPVIVDPKPGQPERFRGATLLTPNNHEAELLSDIKITDEQSLKEAAKQIMEKLDLEAILITRGEAGMTLKVKGKPFVTIPTVAKEVYDVTGAGDTVIATLALGLACRLTLAEAATLANYAAGIVVGKVGTATTTTNELLEVIP